MRPSSTYSRLLFPVIAGADAVGLSIGLIIPLTSIVLVAAKVENNQIAPVAMGAGFFSGFLETAVLAFFILLVLRREGAAAPGGNRI